MTEKSKTSNRETNQTEGTRVHRTLDTKEHNVLCTPGGDRRPVHLLLSLVLFKASCFLTVLLDSLQSLSPSLPLSPFEERNTLLIKRERERRM